MQDTGLKMQNNLTTECFPGSKHPGSGIS